MSLRVTLTAGGSLVAMLADFGVYIVSGTQQPEYDDKAQRVVEASPTLIDGVWTQTWNVVDLTQREKDQIYNEKSQEVRSRRNVLLIESDWTQLPDTPANTVAWAEYRQSLRNVTDQSGFPFEIIWPNPPQ